MPLLSITPTSERETKQVLNENILQLTKLTPSEETVTVKHTQRNAKDALAETVTVVSIKTADDGRTVEDLIEHTITPFTYSKLFKVLGHLNRISIDDFQAFDFNDPIGLAQLVMHAMVEAGDDIQAIVCLAINRPLEYLDTLMPDDGLKLTVAVVRVNKDFFVQRILPMIATLKAEVTTMKAEVTGDAESGSSIQDYTLSDQTIF